MQPSDFLASFGRGFGSPCRRPTSGAGACSADRLGGRRVRLPTHRLRRWITGSPSDRKLPRRGKGLPGYWSVLFVRAVVQHPAGYDPSSPLLLFEKIHGEGAFAELLKQDDDVRAHLSEAAIERHFALDHALAHVDEIIDRVLEEAMTK